MENRGSSSTDRVSHFILRMRSNGRIPVFGPARTMGTLDEIQGCFALLRMTGSYNNDGLGGAFILSDAAAEKI